MDDETGGCCGLILAIGVMWGIVYEVHTWVINAEAATKRYTYNEMVVSDTRDWIKDSGSFITEFGLTKQTLDQKIESVATKYAPILNDLDSKLEYQELELKSKIKSLEKILTHFKREIATDKELNK